MSIHNGISPAASPKKWGHTTALSLALGVVALVVASFATAAAHAQKGRDQCTLDGAEKKKAMVEIRNFFQMHDATLVESSITFFVTNDNARIEAEVDRLIERERGCCSGLSFEKKVAGKRIEITVSGPADEIDRAVAFLFPSRR